jgi:hypothetical protein
MGCDIHTWAEVRAADGGWRIIGDEFDDPFYRPDKPVQVDDDGFRWNHPKTDHPYVGRCYNLFGILANVRNGYGFAGCDMGIGFWPLSAPRGVPADATPGYLAQVKEWGADGHSHSHATLAELLAYDWDQSTILRGYVQHAEFSEWEAKGSPSSWCGDVSGNRVVKVSNEEMSLLIVAGDQEALASAYTQIEWRRSYREAVGSNWFKSLEALGRLGKPDDVRMVFFFDN